MKDLSFLSAEILSGNALERRGLVHFPAYPKVHGVRRVLGARSADILEQRHLRLVLGARWTGVRKTKERLLILVSLFKHASSINQNLYLAKFYFTSSTIGSSSLDFCSFTTFVLADQDLAALQGQRCQNESSELCVDCM